MTGTSSTLAAPGRDPDGMRSRLLGAALTVLRRDGAAALTVRAITGEAGCSTTGVYTWFGGKHGLVEAIYVDGFESFDRAVAERLAVDDLDGAGAAYREWAIANPTRYLVMFGRAVPDFEPSPSARERARRSFQALIDAVGRAGASDPPAAAYHLYAPLHGYVMLELIGVGPAEPDERARLFRRGLVHAAGSLG